MVDRVILGWPTLPSVSSDLETTGWGSQRSPATFRRLCIIPLAPKGGGWCLNQGDEVCGQCGGSLVGGCFERMREGEDTSQRFISRNADRFPLEWSPGGEDSRSDYIGQCNLWGHGVSPQRTSEGPREGCEGYEWTCGSNSRGHAHQPKLWFWTLEAALTWDGSTFSHNPFVFGEKYYNFFLRYSCQHYLFSYLKTMKHCSIISMTECSTT